MLDLIIEYIDENLVEDFVRNNSFRIIEEIINEK
jgi:hypothetical protein